MHLRLRGWCGWRDSARRAREREDAEITTGRTKSGVAAAHNGKLSFSADDALQPICSSEGLNVAGDVLVDCFVANPGTLR